MRPLLAILAAAALALGTACSSMNGNPKLLAIKPPDDGVPLPEATWAEIEAGTSRYGESDSFWLIPITFAGRSWQFDAKAQEADFTSYGWFDLGPLFIFLPLWVDYDRTHYWRADGKTAEQSITWTPFWAGSKQSNWDGERFVEYDVYGVPLFYSHVGVKEPVVGFRYNVNTTLWTLGPMLMTADMERKTVAQDAERGAIIVPEFDGYFFTPAFAGGVPGMLLWSSYSLKTDSGTDIVAHGPLFGFALYFSATQGATGLNPDGSAKPWRKRDRKVVLGVLWDDEIERNADGEVVNASHGPVWGLLGWGRKNGAPTVRFLWIDIPVGSSNLKSDLAVENPEAAAAEE